MGKSKKQKKLEQKAREDRVASIKKANMTAGAIKGSIIHSEHNLKLFKKCVTNGWDNFNEYVCEDCEAVVLQSNINYKWTFIVGNEFFFEKVPTCYEAQNLQAKAKESQVENLNE